MEHLQFEALEEEDFDGTVTKSNIRGLLLPALGLSDWKHGGVVEL